MSECLEGWLADRSAREQPVAGSVEEEFRGYLTCGLLCFGFARAACVRCPQKFVVAYSCKRRGVCPSWNGRHMAQTAAHLVDHVIPPVPVRQCMPGLRCGRVQGRAERIEKRPGLVPAARRRASRLQAASPAGEPAAQEVHPLLQGQCQTPGDEFLDLPVALGGEGGELFAARR